MEIEKDKLINGDCLTEMRKFPDNCIDLIVTDPPYALVSGSYKDDSKHSGGFMGKKWDASLPSVEIWKQCLRVLKPGAFAFIMSAPRQDVLSRMIIRLEDAGFNINFSSMYHAFSSGFPKAANMGKMVSKLQGADKSDEVKTGAGSEGNTFPLSNTYHDYKLTEDGRRLNGAYAGFQPKPAVEIIIVAMKPLSEKNYTAQALKNGKGVIFFDNCRIPYISNDDKEGARRNGYLPDFRGGNFGNRDEGDVKKRVDLGKVNTVNEIGRFPANIIVSDDVLNDGKITKSSGGSGEATKQGLDRTDIGYGFKRIDNASGLGGYGDSGSFSRYFDVDLWFEERVKKLPSNVRRTFPFLITPKASTSERESGCENMDKKHVNPAGLVGAINTGTEPAREPKANHHPCVKSVKLMTYLITLGSRELDLVLDPFLGSGTTAVAASLISRKYIGIELSKEYYDIACARVKSETVNNLFNYCGGEEE